MKKRAVLNIQNEDQYCFVWCILAHKHPVDFKHNANRVNHYRPYWNELDITDLEFPTPLKQIPAFEKKNKLSINVFAWEEKELVPLHVSKERGVKPINLLIISEGDKRHYCLIRNFSRLANYRTKHDGKEYFCFNCIHACYSQERLDKHLEYCLAHKAQRVSFPDDPIVKFKAVAKTMRMPWVIYADFECCTVKQDGDKYQHHEVNSFAFLSVSEYEENEPVLYRGEDAGQKFIEMILQERDRIVDMLMNPRPMVMTDEDQRAFNAATTCYLCAQGF